jgi:hypothetical protein
MNDDTRPTVLVTVSAETISNAVRCISSCETCNPESADDPFEYVLEEVMGFTGEQKDYFMTEPAACPRCSAQITEQTLVEWEGRDIRIIPFTSSS